MRRKFKGVTLLEIIVTLAILTIGISLAGQMITFSMKGQQKANEEFDFQGQMRLTSQTLNNEIRKSTVLFAVPQNVFESKKDEWNYIGLKDPKTLVSYTWNSSTNTHDEKILIKSEENNSFNPLFKKNNKDSKLIEFNLQGYTDGATDTKMNIKTELEAMNSIVVEDGGTDFDPATAIAYRTDSTPQPETETGEKVITLITLVLDKSGSMGWSMNDGSGKTKLTIMNNEVTKLLNRFAGNNNIAFSIVPFSDTAKDAYLSSSLLNTGYHLGNSINFGGIDKAEGGTNTGDGLRKAFYRLKDVNTLKASNPNQPLIGIPGFEGLKVKDIKLSNNIILLTDGDPTQWIQKSNSDSTFVTDKTTSGVSKYNDNTIKAMDYVEEISKIVTSYKAYTEDEDGINSYIIGFGTSTAQNNRLHEINGYLTRTGEIPKPVATPTSELELEIALGGITQNILDEVWHIYGPY